MKMLIFFFKWTEQIKEEWNQTNLSLQTAREEVGDLSLQMKILTSGKNCSDCKI